MYNNSEKKIAKILDIWKLIEILTPNPTITLQNFIQKASEAHNNGYKQFKSEENQKKNSNKYDNNNDRAFFLEDNPYLEDFDKSLHKKEKDTYVCWHVYIGYIDWSKAEIKLKKRLDELFGRIENPLKEDTKSNSTLTPVLGFIIGNKGKLYTDSITVSTAAWAYGKIMSKDFTKEKIDTLLDDIDSQHDILNHLVRLNKEESEKVNEKESEKVNEKEGEKVNVKEAEIYVNYKQIVELRNHLIDKLNLKNDAKMLDCEFCIRKVKYIDSKEKNISGKEITYLPYEEIPKLEMFNSFFISELDLVKSKISNWYKDSAIAQYLGARSKPNSIDLLKDNQELKVLLQPDKMQPARWPSSTDRSLGALQLAVVNYVLTESDNTDIFAINGPPGTGKTTTLSDLIANIYVKRAEKLASLTSPAKGFEETKGSPNNSPNAKKKKLLKKKLISDLEKYSIVVASSNNAAVENITKELPLKSKIASEYRDTLKFFDWTFENKNNWGVFAATLGKKENITQFLEQFWWKEVKDKKEKEKGIGLRIFFKLLLDQEKKKTKNIQELLPDYHRDYQKVWTEACNDFNTTLEEIRNVYKNIDNIINLSRKKQEQIRKFDYDIEDKIQTLEKEKKELAKKLSYTKQDIKSVKDDIKRHDEKMDFWMKVHRFFRTTTYYFYDVKTSDLDERAKHLCNQEREEEQEIDKIKNELEPLKFALKKIKEIDADLLPSIASIENYKFNKNSLIESSYWKQDYKDIQKTSPFYNIALEETRNRLFMQAIKLHEIFINANAREFLESIDFFNDALKNKEQNINPGDIKTAWNIFFMIVPVVSTTFHSFGNMFKHFGEGEIDWLIIDEAGQTSPQCAAGALYRAKKVIVVGDPMQTTPISALSDRLVEHLFKKYEIEPRHWAPTAVSLQSIADRISQYQTKYNADNPELSKEILDKTETKKNKEIIVGFPLIVHRRCREPMFSICNEIAYNNKMVSAVLPDNESFRPIFRIRDILGKSRWINVVDSADPPKHYKSEAEITQLIIMIKDALAGEDRFELIEKIFIISFYKKLAEEIKNRLRNKFSYISNEKIHKFCEKNIGTIHSFQGKENDTVIMVLGAQHQSYLGAREVMVKIPNVLNVGVSRAQTNLYVIGNKSLWEKNRYMQVMIQKLEDFEKEIE